MCTFVDEICGFDCVPCFGDLRPCSFLLSTGPCKPERYDRLVTVGEMRDWWLLKVATRNTCLRLKWHCRGGEAEVYLPHGDWPNSI